MYSKEKRILKHRNKKMRWLIHCGLFVVLQIIFMNLDGRNGWHIFSLNPMGEWAVEQFEPFVDWFSIYENVYFKLITLVWIVIFVVDTVLTFAISTEKQEKTAG